MELHDIFQHGVQIQTKLRHTDKKALAKKSQVTFHFIVLKGLFGYKSNWKSS